MQINQILFFLIVFTFGQLAFGISNHMTHFSINHCVKEKCVIFSGEKAFLNFSGHFLAASNITMKMNTEDNRYSFFRCIEFSANLIQNFFICDNRADHGDSLTIDYNLNVKKY